MSGKIRRLPFSSARVLCASRRSKSFSNASITCITSSSVATSISSTSTKFLALHVFCIIVGVVRLRAFAAFSYSCRRNTRTSLHACCQKDFADGVSGTPFRKENNEDDDDDDFFLLDLVEDSGIDWTGGCHSGSTGAGMAGVGNPTWLCGVVLAIGRTLSNISSISLDIKMTERILSAILYSCHDDCVQECLRCPYLTGVTLDGFASFISNRRFLIFSKASSKDRCRSFSSHNSMSCDCLYCGVGR
jgi:hypothetical protein